jgi:hypothetical protein
LRALIIRPTGKLLSSFACKSLIRTRAVKQVTKCASM